MGNRQKIYDSELLLNSAGLVAASAAGSEVIDTGGGFTDGVIITDVSAIEVDTGDELYTFSLQGTNTAAFGGTDIVDLVMFNMGDAAVLVGDADLGIGRVVTPFRNQFQETVYRYLRIYLTIAGTIVTGINYTCYLSK